MSGARTSADKVLVTGTVTPLSCANILRVAHAKLVLRERARLGARSSSWEPGVSLSAEGLFLWALAHATLRVGDA